MNSIWDDERIQAEAEACYDEQHGVRSNDDIAVIARHLRRMRDEYEQRIAVLKAQLADTGARQRLRYLRALIGIYDALAPKPDDWPDGAEWFTVSVTGYTEWWADEPDYDGGFWYHDTRGPPAAGDADMPPDIPPSWCKWRRTGAIRTE